MLIHPSGLSGRVDGLSRGVRWGIPVALGALIALGHEPWMRGVWPVVIGLTIAMLVLPQALRRATVFGWLLGLGYFAVTLRWIVEPFLVDIARHGWMAPFAIVLMAGGLALFWGLAAWLARRVAGPRAVGMIWFAVALTAAELARGHVFSGFPWGLLSYTAVGTLWDVWLAWVGPYGTSGVILAVTSLTAYSLHRGWALIWPALVAVLLATLGLQGLTPQAPVPEDAQTVRLIQPNVPQNQKWDPDWMPVFFDRAIALTGAGEPADVVIWPETSIPALLDYAQPWLEQMSLAARGAPVVAGIQRSELGSYYNSAIVIEDPTTVSAIADKSHLVPFGEYIPLAWLLKPLGLSTLVDQVAGFTPGTGSGLIQIDGLGRARVLICYEGIFPEEIQRGDVRPDVVLILTNDAWFGAGAGPRQHLMQAQARAIEQGLPVIRAANTGISAVIDARGKITASLALNEAGSLDAAVPVALPQTLYAKIGDWPLAVVLLIALGIGVGTRRRLDVDGATRPV